MGKKLLKAVEREVKDEVAKGETGMYFSSGHHQWDAHHTSEASSKTTKKSKKQKDVAADKKN